jgi:hypothetical protein
VLIYIVGDPVGDVTVILVTINGKTVFNNNCWLVKDNPLNNGRVVALVLIFID